MKFVKVQNGIVDKYPYNLQELSKDFKNVSFPTNISSDLDSLAQFEIYPVYERKPDFLPSSRLEQIIEKAPTFINEKWYETWEVIPSNITLNMIAEEKEQELIKEIQNLLDTFAKVRGYDNIISCTSYINSTVAKYKTEAEYCIKLRDYMWQITYEKINSLKNPQNNTNWIDLNIPYVVFTIIQELKDKYNMNSFSSSTELL